MMGYTMVWILCSLSFLVVVSWYKNSDAIFATINLIIAQIIILLKEFKEKQQ